MKKILFLLIVSAGIIESTSAQHVYRDEYKKSLDEQYASGVFKGTNNSYMLVPQDDPSSTASFTVFQYLQGRIAGLVIDNTKLYAPVVRWRMAQTAFFLDEMRVDASVLAMVNMNDIGLIKVFRPPFIGAFGNGPGGAIAVYTLRGEDEEEE